MSDTQRFLALMLEVRAESDEMVQHIRKDIEVGFRPDRDELICQALEGLTALSCGLAADL